MLSRAKHKVGTRLGVLRNMVMIISEPLGSRWHGDSFMLEDFEGRAHGGALTEFDRFAMLPLVVVLLLGCVPS